MKDMPDLIINIVDRKSKTKEEFSVTADQAFIVRTLLHQINKTAPKSFPDWIKACKIEELGLDK